MKKDILDHYLKFSLFTDPGCYKSLLKKIPDDIRKIGSLIRKQIIHRVTLRYGNTGSNEDFRYGDMDKIPWWRLRCEDDILPAGRARPVDRRHGAGGILQCGRAAVRSPCRRGGHARET